VQVFLLLLVTDVIKQDIYMIMYRRFINEYLPFKRHMCFIILSGPSWSWSDGSWIYNYLCNHFLSPLKLWVRIPLMARCIRYNIMW